MVDLSSFGLTESPAGPPVPPVPCNGERRININHDKVFSVAIGIAEKSREQHPEYSVEIGPTRQTNGVWDRFRVDRMEAVN